MAHLYFDTDVFHRLGGTFARQTLPDRLRDQIVLSPITMMEVLTHLTLRNADRVLRQIQAMYNWVNAQRATVLPWTNAAIAALGFGMPLPEDGYFEPITRSIQACLNAQSADHLRQPARVLKDALDREKRKSVVRFTALIHSYRQTPMSDEDFEAVFVEGLRQRIPNAPVRPVRDVINALSAYCEFEHDKLRIAVANPGYRPEAHANDLLDVEQLVYLADPRFSFVTCDAGYLRRVMNSPQRNRIHVAPVAIFGDAAQTIDLIQGITA